MKTWYYRFLIGMFIGFIAGFVYYLYLVKNINHYFVDLRKNEEVFLKKNLNYDIILLGSSRMLNTVNPRILDSALKCTTFNLGQSGAKISELKVNLDAYLQNNLPPKLVIAAFDVHMLSADKNFTFYPFYLNSIKNPVIEKALAEDGVKTFLYKKMPFLTITEYGDYFKGTIIKNFTGQTELKSGDFYFQGYKSNTLDTITEAILPSKNVRFGITHKGQKDLDSLIALCVSKGITLIGTYSPEYDSINLKYTTNSDSILNIFQNSLAKAHYPFFRNDTLSLCKNKSMFANIGHVNRKGADIYSAILARQITDNYPNLFAK